MQPYREPGKVPPCSEDSGDGYCEPANLPILSADSEHPFAHYKLCKL